VFAIITRVASEAEGIHFAQQQLRAVFDRLHNDLRGATREGYLRINPLPGTDPTVPSSPQYHRDTLAFTTIGRCASTFASNAYEATAAEVVYTNNVRTPTAVLTVDPGSQSRQVDARRGILGRGQWLMAGGSSPSTAHDLQDPSVPTYLCDMFENQQMTGTSRDDRVSKWGPHLVVYPWTVIEGLPSQHAETLRRVMASCVSEFYVETFNPPAGGGGGSSRAAGRPQTTSRTSPEPTPGGERQAPPPSAPTPGPGPSASPSPSTTRAIPRPPKSTATIRSNRSGASFCRRSSGWAIRKPNRE